MKIKLNFQKPLLQFVIHTYIYIYTDSRLPTFEYVSVVLLANCEHVTSEILIVEPCSGPWI